MSKATDYEMSLKEERGYRPDELSPGAPIFSWPIKIGAALKWFFGVPGYLLPWHVLFFGIAVLLWKFYFPPSLDAGRPSLAWVFALLGSHLVVLVLFVGAWHLHLYVRRAQQTNYKYDSRWQFVDDGAFLFRTQSWDNIFWNVFSAVPIWTIYAALTLWLQASGSVRTVHWQTNPSYCVVLTLVIPLWVDIHFYATHRLLHWSPLYKTVHKLHHRNVNPGPWSGLSMHPIEHVLYFSAVCLFWALPAHPLHTLYLLVYMALGPSLAHQGFDRLVIGRGTFSTLHYMHYLHHRYFNANYGGGIVPIDKWVGTFYDGSEAGAETLKRLARNRMMLLRRAKERKVL
jgi:sterol desaturase/sphingolipid hydroxylase (fatty acid hydroxylase superfamily)